MLVLSRKVGERVLISGGIAIELIEIRGDKVRLGFTAPQDVAISREELGQPGTLKRKDASNANETEG